MKTTTTSFKTMTSEWTLCKPEGLDISDQIETVRKGVEGHLNAIEQEGKGEIRVTILIEYAYNSDLSYIHIPTNKETL